MATYINDWGERERAWYEVKRYLKGTNGKYDPIVTYHNTRRQAESEKRKADATGQYDVFIDFVAENSGIID